MDKDIAQLSAEIERVWEKGIEKGLDPLPIHFEIVPATIMYEFGAYGLPGRFSHWTHGKAYEQMKTMYDHGLSKIYELVINTVPSYAFLMEGNSLIQNKMIAAHVMAHADFFKNNLYFRNTSREMLNIASVDAGRIHHYEESHGREQVEAFLDAVLSIQEHVDYSLTRQRACAVAQAPHSPREEPYEDLMGPRDLIPTPSPPARIPPKPEKDVLGFIAEHAPDLAEWQRDIVWIVRRETLYFIPQMQTKIMNEGWATYWHLRIMREMELPQGESLEFARLHAAVIAPMPGKRAINPYHVGLRIFHEIERRAGGPEKLFEVRELDSDQSFLRNHLTRELVDELDLYTYEQREEEWVVADRNWEHVRDHLVDTMTNLGHPTIKVEDGDYHGKGELLLKHYFEGQELDLPYAERALRHVQRLWGRPAHLETVKRDRRILLSYDGEKNTAVELDTGEPAEVEPEPDLAG